MFHANIAILSSDTVESMESGLTGCMNGKKFVLFSLSPTEWFADIWGPGAGGRAGGGLRACGLEEAQQDPGGGHSSRSSGTPPPPTPFPRFQHLKFQKNYSYFNGNNLRVKPEWFLEYLTSLVLYR